MTPNDPVLNQILSGPVASALNRRAAEYVAVPCATAGCTDTALVHPTTMAAYDFDETNVLCAECTRESIPADVLAMRPAFIERERAGWNAFWAGISDGVTEVAS